MQRPNFIIFHPYAIFSMGKFSQIVRFLQKLPLKLLDGIRNIN
jgi:hypothetical protein